MSGDPPSDVTTKDPFQDMTEQPFTFDYEDATHSQAMDEEEGKQLTCDKAFYSQPPFVSVTCAQSFVVHKTFSGASRQNSVVLWSSRNVLWKLSTGMGLHR